MNLKQLEYFVRVAELGSFSKAALVLNIAQPALDEALGLVMGLLWDQNWPIRHWYPT